MGNVLRRNIIASSRNSCWYGNEITRSLCIVNLLLAINVMKPMSVTMKTQEWAYFAML